MPRQGYREQKMQDWGNNNFSPLLLSLTASLSSLIFSLELEQIKLAARDSWEDEDVADSWDAEEEQEEAEEEVKPIEPVKPKKAAALVKPSQDATPPPPQETDQARKERLNRLIQESDLENAMALFGISKSEINVDQVLEITKKDATTPVSSAPSVDGGYFESAKPQTWTEFETLSNTVVKKLKSLESSKHYPNFLESLFRALLNDRDVPEMRKLANMASELVSAKQRDKLSQMNGKKKVAPSLAGASKKNGRADMMDFGSNDDDDFDGF